MSLVDNTPRVSPEAGDSGPTDRAGGGRAGLLAAVFLLVVAIGMWRHEMWGDEWQAWLLARDAGSLPELFRLMRYEGHLPTWHLILVALARFTGSVAAMQVAHAAIATGSVYLIARFAPFSWALKVFVPFGYFFLYEYGVIARHYALAVLALFAFCALFSVRGRHPLAVAAALLLLAITSVYGTILAAAVTGMLLLEAATGPAETPGMRRRRIGARVALVVWLGGVAVALFVALMRPVQALSGVPGAPALPVLSRWALASTVAKLTPVYLPIPDALPAQWGAHLISDETRLGLATRFGLALGIVGGAAMLFARTPFVLFLFAAGTGGVLAFNHLVFGGFIRHHGHLFVLFVACLWLAHTHPRRWRPPRPLEQWTGLETRWASAFVTGLVAAQLAGAALLYVTDLSRPFSAATQTARFIQESGLGHLPIAASPAHPAIPIAGTLDRPIHYVATGSESTFLPWREYVRGRDRFISIQLLRPFLEAHPTDALVVLGAPLEAWDDGLLVEELARFRSGVVRDEVFVVYRVRGSPGEGDPVSMDGRR